jgi:hypothetical protein
MENRNGLAVDVLVTQATGTAKREAGLTMVKKLRDRHPTRRLTLGADKNFDTHDFVADLRDLKVTPQRGPEHHPAARQSHRWPHRDPARLSHQSAHPQAD